MWTESELSLRGGCIPGRGATIKGSEERGDGPSH